MQSLMHFKRDNQILAAPQIYDQPSCSLTHFQVPFEFCTVRHHFAKLDPLYFIYTQIQSIGLSTFPGTQS